MSSSIRHAFHVLNGVRHHVAEAGEGEPLILLHGWPEFWATWEPVAERLEPRWRLIMPDFRGFGDSDNPNPGPSDRVGADTLAEDVLALVDRLGIGRAALVGHDVASFVMQRFAIRWPDRVAGLFFFNCPTHGVGQRWREAAHINEIWYQTFHQMPSAAALCTASREAVRAHIGHFLKHWCHRKNAFDPVIERWTDNFMRPGNMQGGFNWYISQNAGRLAVMAGTAPKPPVIGAPTRVLWGRHDPVLKSAWADVLADYFSDVEVSFAEHSAHFVHYEEPDLAAGEIERFFTRIGAGGA